MTYHGKNQFAHWPVTREVFNEIDYSQGVDLSWWKNHPEWTSMFAWNYEDDFFAGYDHGKQAGTVSVANHHVAPGKKFWEWSAGPRGELWDHILTEKDGPELELMSGAYSDNQPDYSWLQPLESKTVRLNWFPIRGLGGVKTGEPRGSAEPGGEGRRKGTNRIQHRGGAPGCDRRAERRGEDSLHKAHRHQPLRAVFDRNRRTRGDERSEDSGFP